MCDRARGFMLLKETTVWEGQTTCIKGCNQVHNDVQVGDTYKQRGF